MRAARLVSRRKIDFLEIPYPDPIVDDEVKIKVEEFSICGSDIYLEYDAGLLEEQYPLTPGAPSHESAGTVVESRDPSYKVGQRVIVIPRDVAGMQEYLVQTKDKLIKIPDWGNLSEWVMCQHSGTVLFSAKQWGNIAGKTIAILGQGGIGLSFTMLAAKQGAKTITGLDLEGYRLKKSLDYGATHSINPTNEDLLGISDEITKGAGYDIVVDASGNVSGLDICVDLVRKGGKVISFSFTPEDDMTFNHRKWMMKNVQLISTALAQTNEPIKEIKEMVDYKISGWMDPGVLKTHQWSWKQVQEAFELYRLRQDNVIKISLSID